MKIPFAKVDCSGNELKYVSEVIKSGWLTTNGKAKEFEEKFSAYVGAKYACSVNSCTAALHLALEAIGIKKGDKVFVPTLTFTASAEVILYMGAQPVFLDVDYNTRLLTPAILKKAIENNPDVKALVLVHYSGQAAQLAPANGEGILSLCKAKGIKIIEDAAHSFPARYNGKYIGSFGDITCFSFYANKTITTGEGGMLVTDDEQIYKRVKTMRLHGIDRDVWHRFTTNSNAWEYDVVSAGFKYNMPDINAVIGLAQLENAERFRSGRQRCAEFYFKRLKDISCIDLPEINGLFKDHAWHLFPIVINPDAPVSRNRFIEMMTDFGIGTSVHYKPLHRMSFYQRKFCLQPKKFPNAERLWKGIVSLPIYHLLSNEELEYIVSGIEEILHHTGSNINSLSQPA